MWNHFGSLFVTELFQGIPAWIAFRATPNYLNWIRFWTWSRSWMNKAAPENHIASTMFCCRRSDVFYFLFFLLYNVRWAFVFFWSAVVFAFAHEFYFCPVPLSLLRGLQFFGCHSFGDFLGDLADESSLHSRHNLSLFEIFFHFGYIFLQIAPDRFEPSGVVFCFFFRNCILSSPGWSKIGLKIQKCDKKRKNLKLARKKNILWRMNIKIFAECKS